jgi:integrase/recombinase XerD
VCRSAHSLDALGDRWLATLRARNAAAHTVASRTKQLRVFLSFCENRSIARPRDVRLETLLAYQAFLFEHRKADGRPLSFITQRERLTAVRVFFRWLLRIGAIGRDVSALIELPRVPRRLPRWVPSEVEVERVIDLPDTSHLLGMRDRAILEVLYSTGIRRAELAALEIYDVDVARGFLTVRNGKGGRDRILPVGVRAAEWTARYLDLVRWRILADPAERTLFLTHAGRRFHPDALSTLVSRYVSKALGHSGACHIFRHAMATAMLDHGADIRYIQEMLGHASLETTQLYTHVSIRRLKQVHEATHPSARSSASPRRPARPAERTRNRRSHTLNDLDGHTLEPRARTTK